MVQAAQGGWRDRQIEMIIGSESKGDAASYSDSVPAHAGAPEIVGPSRLLTYAGE